MGKKHSSPCVRDTIRYRLVPGHHIFVVKGDTIQYLLKLWPYTCLVPAGRQNIGLHLMLENNGSAFQQALQNLGVIAEELTLQHPLREKFASPMEYARLLHSDLRATSRRFQRRLPNAYPPSLLIPGIIKETFLPFITHFDVALLINSRELNRYFLDQNIKLGQTVFPPEAAIYFLRSALSHARTDYEDRIAFFKLWPPESFKIGNLASDIAHVESYMERLDSEVIDPFSQSRQTIVLPR